MFRFLYGIAVSLYGLSIRLAAPFNKKAAMWKEGRKNMWVTLIDSPQLKEKRIWFHCASLGEFEQGRPVIEEFKASRPEWSVILTFFSPSGYEVRKNYEHADMVLYLPLDTKKNARYFISTFRPRIAVFVKYEFWYNYMYELNEESIPAYLISANFRPDQWFFKPVGKAFIKAIDSFTKKFVQNEASKDLLVQHGIEDVVVAGDTRFDRVDQLRQHAKSLYAVEEFRADSRVIVAGSTWPLDEEILIEYINNEPSDLKWIIAPHEVDDAHIQKIVKALEKPYILYSELAGAGSSNYKVLVVDNIGLLSSLYAYGDLAYIGGGFGVGIHNVLEPACYGVPVIFGPNYQKFREAVELVERGGGISIVGYDDFLYRMGELLDVEGRLEETGKISSDYVKENTGATSMIVDNLLKE